MRWPAGARSRRRAAGRPAVARTRWRAPRRPPVCAAGASVPDGVVQWLDLRLHEKLSSDGAGALTSAAGARSALYLHCSAGGAPRAGRAPKAPSRHSCRADGLHSATGSTTAAGARLTLLLHRRAQCCPTRCTAPSISIAGTLMAPPNGSSRKGQCTGGSGAGACGGQACDHCHMPGRGGDHSRRPWHKNTCRGTAQQPKN